MTMAPSYDTTDVSSAATSPYSILRILGGWGNVNGPGLFMIRCLIAGTSSAAVLGLSAAVVGSSIWGTASLPFIIGSSAGYGLGVWRWYTNSIIESMDSIDKYPELLRLHLLANFPWQRTLRDKRLEWYHSRTFERSWVLQSMLVVGWLSARPAIDEIYVKREQRIVELYGDKAEEEETKLAEKMDV